MSTTFRTDVNIEDWEYVLDHSKDANFFHTPLYYMTQQDIGHPCVYLCAYEHGQPIAVLVGEVYAERGHPLKSLLKFRVPWLSTGIEFGTRSGNAPVIIDSVRHRKTLCRMMFTEIMKLPRVTRALKIILYADNAISLVSGKRQCTDQQDITTLIDLQRPLDSLFMSFNKKCRTAIRYAEKQSLAIAIDHSDTAFISFYDLYKKRMHVKGVRVLPLKTLQHKFRKYREYDCADLWVAKRDSEMISAAWVWKYKQKINWVYGASNDVAFKTAANNLLQWRIMQHYKRLGYAEYNMWGLFPLAKVGHDPEVEGYGKFKLSFNPEVKKLTRYLYERA